MGRELKQICRKALQSSPERRYSSATELGADVERFLSDEPVSVCRDPVWTRLRRRLKRHPAVAAATLATLFLTAAWLTAWSLLTAAHAREIDSRNRQLDELVRKEKELRLTAEQSERRTDNALQFITDALRSPDPDLDGRDVRVVDVLEDAAARLFEDYPDDPLLQARISNATGFTLYRLGEYESSAELLWNAHQLYMEHAGARDANSLIAAKNLTSVWLELGYPQAIPLMKETLDLSRQTFGDQHELTLGIERGLIQARLETGITDGAVERLQQLLPIYRQVFGPGAAEVETLRGSLARAWTRVGEPLKAADEYRRVYQARLQEYSPASLTSINAGSNYANALTATNQKSEAARLMEKLLFDARQSLGDDHHTTIILTRSLGTYYLNNGQTERGIPLVEEAVRRTSQRYGDQHRLSLTSANALGIALMTVGKYNQAADQLERSWRNYIAVHGPDHSETLTCANNVAMAHRLAGRHDEAISIFQDVLETQDQTVGAEHPLTIRTMVNLAGALHDVDRHAESIPVLRQASKLAAQIEPDHKWYQTAESLLASAYLKLGDHQNALTSINQCYESRLRTMPEHWLTWHTMSVLGEALMKTGELEAAEPYLTDSATRLAELDQVIPARAKFRIDEARQRFRQFQNLKSQREKRVKGKRGQQGKTGAGAGESAINGLRIG